MSMPSQISNQNSQTSEYEKNYRRTEPPLETYIRKEPEDFRLKFYGKLIRLSLFFRPQMQPVPGQRLLLFPALHQKSQP